MKVLGTRNLVFSNKDRVTCGVESAGALALRSQHLYSLGSECTAYKLAARREERWEGSYYKQFCTSPIKYVNLVEHHKHQLEIKPKVA